MDLTPFIPLSYFHSPFPLLGGRGIDCQTISAHTDLLRKEVCDIIYSGMQSFMEEVAATPGGENVRACIQCGVCSGTCPMASQMEYTPRKIIALIRAGMQNEVLSSSSMWHCLSCYLCTVRCPRDVKPTELAHALESLAIEHGFTIKETNTPAMYQGFVSSIRNNGRVHEFGMMLKYYLTTNPLAALRILPVGLRLFRHKRMPLLPKKVEGRGDLARIIQRFREVRGAQ